MGDEPLVPFFFVAVPEIARDAGAQVLRKARFGRFRGIGGATRDKFLNYFHVQLHTSELPLKING
jgi:hypothetical protein